MIFMVNNFMCFKAASNNLLHDSAVLLEPAAIYGDHSVAAPVKPALSVRIFESRQRVSVPDPARVVLYAPPAVVAVVKPATPINLAGIHAGDTTANHRLLI